MNLAKKKSKKNAVNQMRLMPFDAKMLRKKMSGRKMNTYDLSRELGFCGVMYSPCQVKGLTDGTKVQPRGDVLAALCEVFDVTAQEWYPKLVR